MDICYNEATVWIKLETQYHVGSGFGLGRVIDSLLRINPDGTPVLPGTTVSGIVAQGLYDLLHFSFFEQEREAMCAFHNPYATEPRLPCAISRPGGDPCVLCYFLGSSAQEGVVVWEDFTCKSDEELMLPMLKSRKCSADERQQYIKPYASHKQEMQTGTVLDKHLFFFEEGAALEFGGTIRFSQCVPEDKAVYLAAAILNTRAVGRRKSRGKGVCRMSGSFVSIENDKKVQTAGFRELVENIGDGKKSWRI